MKSKKIRYYYWLVLEFFKKHFIIILSAFLLTFLIIFSTKALYPFFSKFIFKQKLVIGLIDNNYSLKKLPEEVLHKISSGLIYINKDGKVVPVLIEDWFMEDGGRRFVLVLKKNLVWNDGKPFTTKDIDLRFKDVSIEKKDKWTIIFKLKKPMPIFINFLSQPLIKPPFIGIGGQYQINKIVKKNDQLKEISLWPIKENLPILSYRFYLNENSLIIAYKKGEINQMYLYRKTLAEPFLKWKNSKVTKEVDYQRLYTLFFNLNKKFLKEREIRTSIRMAIDVEKFSDYGFPALTSYSPLSWVYNPDITSWTYDVESAKELLKKKMTASEEAKLNFYTFYEYSEITDNLKDQLSKLDLKINLKYLSMPTPPSDFDLFFVSIKLSEDPDQYYYWHSQSKNNITGYVNLKVDQLLEDGRQTTNYIKRKTIYQNLQKVLYEDPPAIFLFFPYRYKIEKK